MLGTPPVGGSASATALVSLRAPTSLANIPTAHYIHILPALVFASQSPYSGGQNVISSRNALYAICPKIGWEYIV
jgi:hypothetical protein